MGRPVYACPITLLFWVVHHVLMLKKNLKKRKAALHSSILSEESRSLIYCTVVVGRL